jgi:phosphoribosylanthranilate isomerase
MVKVKICGITNLRDALMATEAGADILGFVFARSPRQVTPEQAAEICAALPSSVTRIGVFVDSDLEFVKKTVLECNLDIAQFHGDESPEYCSSFPYAAIKAFRVKDRASLDMLLPYRVEAYLLDTYVPGKAGGTGQTFDWSLAIEAKKYGRIILSGGLTPDNVARAVAQVEPFAVDVSSGVEIMPGRKDPEKVKAFIKAAKGHGQ